MLKVKACYIHIPFCHNICSYCDFCKMYYNEHLVDKYLYELEKEITNTYQGEYLDTIYIGGGTPSSLSIKQLEKLFKILSIFNKSSNIEYTIEGNFLNTTKEKLLLYKKYGINRLSFGLESINHNNLNILERKESKEKTKEIITLAKSLGFNNINIDLMYAIPNETIEVLKEDISFILSLDIEHISTYSLILENNTKLKINNTEYISEDLDYEMYKTICKELSNNNYLHYEISNFSKDNKQSRHNLTYWNNNQYYGFGLGASSYLNNKRITNTRSITSYLKGNYQKDVELLTNKDIIEYEVLLNLRKKEGISLTNFYQKYHHELSYYYDYQGLVNSNYLEEKNNNLSIPEDKWYISNEIIVRILEKEKVGIK